jgi:hypothetical protein
MIMMMMMMMMYTFISLEGSRIREFPAESTITHLIIPYHFIPYHFILYNYIYLCGYRPVRAV